MFSKFVFCVASLFFFLQRADVLQNMTLEARQAATGKAALKGSQPTSSAANGGIRAVTLARTLLQQQFN